MSKDFKQQMLKELDCRIEKLEKHRYDRIVVTGNQYDELNQALSKVINVPLQQELSSLKEFVQEM